MRTYVINLAHRTDRMALMDAQLNALNMPYERIEAVNGLGDDDIGYPTDHPRLAKAEFACYLSHVSLWQKFVDSGESHCLVLEDDVVLAKSMPEILSHKAFLEPAKALIRLEKHRHSSLVSKFAFGRFKSRRLIRLFAFESGTGALILHRDFARYLLKVHSDPKIPVDHITNNPQQSGLKGHKIYILDPVPGIQRLRLSPDSPEFNGESDLKTTRSVMTTDTKKTFSKWVLHIFIIQPLRNIRHNLFRTRKHIQFSKD